MTGVERLEEFCRRHELELDTRNGRYGVCMDGASGSIVWLWPGGTMSVEDEAPEVIVSIVGSARELGLLEKSTLESIASHRDALRKEPR